MLLQQKLALVINNNIQKTKTNLFQTRGPYHRHNQTTHEHKKNGQPQHITQQVFAHDHIDTSKNILTAPQL